MLWSCVTDNRLGKTEKPQQHTVSDTSRSSSQIWCSITAYFLCNNFRAAKAVLLQETVSISSTATALEKKMTNDDSCRRGRGQQRRQVKLLS